ncbi:MAG: MBL fold metallo-hydrolase [Candidatus Marinimicrobia bacterium]|nr:MBL fold metallo-hydrolase [Candidatus Neomarinimicrobiota bacterium]
MKIERLVVGQLQSNCYLVWDEKTQEGIIIDPADDGHYLLNRIQDLEIKPILILATHGHVDHLLAVTELKLALKIPFWMSLKDEFLIKRIKSAARYWFKIEADPPPKIDKNLEAGNLIKFGQEKLKVIETPGHSPGGLSFYGQGVVFDGDTLFNQGIGRYDFAYAKKDDLFHSIAKLLELPEETLIYPGHGPETSVGEEKKNFQIYKSW